MSNNYQFNTCDSHKPVLVQRKSFNYGIVNSSIDPASPLYRYGHTWDYWGGRIHCLLIMFPMFFDVPNLLIAIQI